MLVALLCEGHALLEGVPGIAKTLMVRALSLTVSADFSRNSVHSRPYAFGCAGY